MSIALLIAMSGTPNRSRFADLDAARHAVDLALPGVEATLRDPRVSGGS